MDRFVGDGLDRHERRSIRLVQIGQQAAAEMGAVRRRPARSVLAETQQCALELAVDQTQRCGNAPGHRPRGFIEHRDDARARDLVMARRGCCRVVGDVRPTLRRIEVQDETESGVVDRARGFAVASGGDRRGAEAQLTQNGVHPTS